MIYQFSGEGWVPFAMPVATAFVAKRSWQDFILPVNFFLSTCWTAMEDFRKWNWKGTVHITTGDGLCELGALVIVSFFPMCFSYVFL